MSLMNFPNYYLLVVEQMKTKMVLLKNALLLIFHQEADDKSKDMTGNMMIQETEKLSSTIAVLQKKLSLALTQVS